MTLSKFLNLGIHFDTAPILLGEQHVQPHIAGDPQENTGIPTFTPGVF